MNESTSETRRALLIGCPADDLKVAEEACQLIGNELYERGFSCGYCMGESATREEILGALHALVQETKAHDTVVIYYIGHGGRCFVHDSDGREPVWGFLVPADHDLAADFQGIADFELSSKIRDLGAITDNVTVILDCCNAAAMVRGSADDAEGWALCDEPEQPQQARSGATVLSVLPKVTQEGLESFHQRCRPELALARVVRVLATASSSSAYQIPQGKGGGGTYFTRELTRALNLSRTTVPMSWDTIVRWARERVGATRPSQRPEVVGPRERLPFSLDTVGDVRSRLTVFQVADGTLRVDGGRLQGVGVGDELSVVGYGQGEHGRFPARVSEVYDDNAVITFVEDVAVDARAALGSGGVGFRGRGTVRVSVGLDEDARRLEGLVERLASAPWLEPVVGAEYGRYGIRVHEDCLHIRGPEGFARKPREEKSPTNVAAVVEDLDDLARADVLLAALEQTNPSSDEEELPRWEARVMVSIGDRAHRPLVSGEHLPVGARLYVDVKVPERGEPTIYVSVLDVGISGRVALLDEREPAGIEIRPGELQEIGRPGRRQGACTVWPSSVAPHGAGRERLIVVASLRPLDLRPLLQHVSKGTSQFETRSSGDRGTERPVSCVDALVWDTRCFDFYLDPPTPGPTPGDDGPPHEPRTVLDMPQREGDASVSQGPFVSPSTPRSPPSSEERAVPSRRGIGHDPTMKSKPVALLAFADPDQVRRLPSLRREQKVIRAALEPEMEVRTLWDVTADDILDEFSAPHVKGRVRLFHFGGHANALELLVANADGQPDIAHATGLADILGAQPGLELVVLNACSTAEQIHRLKDVGIRAVVATSRKIIDEVAADFARRFYEDLVTQTLREAYSSATRSVRLKGGENPREFVTSELSADEWSDEWPWVLWPEDPGEWTLMGGNTIVVDDILEIELATRLAQILNSAGLAKVILIRARFPRVSLPHFGVPIDFWTSVMQELRSGRVEGGLARLLDEVAKMYPGNQYFAKFAGKTLKIEPPE